MNDKPRDIAKSLLFNALSDVLKDIHYHGDDLTMPQDKSYEHYRDMGFLVKKADKDGEDQSDYDLYFIGLRVGKPQSMPYDAFELVRRGGELHMRANGKIGHLITFTGKGAEMVTNDFLMNIIERSMIENTEMLAAIDSLDKGKKSEIRKTSK
ncbi:hypothetical protein pETSU_274 [Edwardsiella phage pEt-SU]|uniref:Uncharacterized protein n=1 Tax=Edwardsiella phage pEt-SU TaxID=2562142 RepID=A0A4D6DX20_9CAUD|nr:hypothetical protein HOV39_gp248 [Edwardsiella phage pEt-SU]QBZ70855.1 hypothetical protein pETSU_274 [Edwardsiella phage pEt-SU]